MAEVVYILCALTSVASAGLLLLKYRKRRTALLLWTAICFSAFALNNVLLFVDLVLVPNIDLSNLRTSTMLLGFMALLCGLIWEKA